MYKKLFFFILMVLSSLYLCADNVKPYYYDIKGKGTNVDNAVFLLIVNYSNNYSQNQFELYYGQQLIQKGKIRLVSSSNLDDCILGDYLGFDEDGNITSAQKDFGKYKILTRYYKDGTLQSYDSIVSGKKEGYSFIYTEDGNVRTMKQYSSGNPSTEYFTYTSNDKTICCNLKYKDNSLYKERVGYEEVMSNDYNQYIYVANGIRLTIKKYDDDDRDKNYSFRIKLENTSTTDILFDPSNILVLGVKGKELFKLNVLSPKDYSLMLAKEDIYEKTSDYVKISTIESFHSFEGFFKVKREESSWIAVLFTIDGITYPYYFNINGNVNRYSMNKQVSDFVPNKNIPLTSNTNTANWFLAASDAILHFDKKYATNIASIVYKSLLSEDNQLTSSSSTNNTYSTRSNLFSSLNSSNNQYSTAFISKANRAIDCLNKLTKVQSKNNVYNICLNYFRAYYQIKRSRLNAAEKVMFNNISQQFEKIKNSLHKRFDCSGDILRAQVYAAENK